MLNLLDTNLKFILFGGKGGVGKTTMASASAVHFANKFPDKKILIFTTDPAPSLGHIFEQKFNNEPKQIKGSKNLWAMEINAEEEMKKFKKQYGDEILDILQKGTYLSNDETEEIFGLDIPGLDEVMGLKKIMDFMNSDEYDMYFLDTAPTGHTLRLLCLPELLDKWIKFLANIRWKYRYMVQRFSKENRLEKADDFLVEMKKTVKNVHALLRDKNKTSFVVVTIAEAMGVMETENLIKDLKKFNIPNSEIIINNVTPNDKNKFMTSRRKLQNDYIKKIESAMRGYNVTSIELASGEIKGMLSLTSLGNKLYNLK
jgi:arsenite/tail-anchored protein-transporting ATPase